MYIREACLKYGRKEYVDLPEGTISTSAQVAEIMRERMDLPMETFWCLALNAKHVLQFIYCVAVGTVDKQVVTPTAVFVPAFKHRRSPITTLILVHNHPSGDPTPSQEDVAVTRRLVQAGEILCVDILDHVIVTSDRYVSLRDLGKME